MFFKKKKMLEEMYQSVEWFPLGGEIVGIQFGSSFYRYPPNL